MKRILIVSCLIYVCSIHAELQKVSGNFDPTFGGNGTGFNLVSLGGAGIVEGIESISLDSQGRIVAGGLAAGDALIMRFTPEGVLDHSFGGSGTGFNLINFGGIDTIRSISLDSQGRIVAGGLAAGDALIMRFTPEGVLDHSFGGNGTGFNLIDLGGADQIFSITLDSQGRIVAGGQGGAGAGDALIMRFTPDGVLDTTFGGNGTGFNLIDLGGADQIRSISLDAQGRIVAGGLAAGVSAIMRFTQDGVLDTTFGGNGTGFNLIDIEGLTNLFTLLLDSQGRIVVGGQGSLAGVPLIMRFTQDGVLDTTFGGNGTGFNLIAINNTFGQINSIVLDVQGKIVAGGQNGSGGSGDALIMRFTPDGVLDTTFGGNGTGFNLLAITGATDTLLSIVLDACNRIVGGGNVGPVLGNFDSLLMRLYNEPLTQLTTAIRQKYCGNIIGD